MGEELVETLQMYFDAGGNRRETARRLHLADRTVAYRLERAEQVLGHGIDGEAGRRLNVSPRPSVGFGALATFRAPSSGALSLKGSRPIDLVRDSAIVPVRMCSIRAMTGVRPRVTIVASRMWVGLHL